MRASRNQVESELQLQAEVVSGFRTCWTANSTRCGSATTFSAPPHGLVELLHELCVPLGKVAGVTEAKHELADSSERRNTVGCEDTRLDHKIALGRRRMRVVSQFFRGPGGGQVTVVMQNGCPAGSSSTRHRGSGCG